MIDQERPSVEEVFPEGATVRFESEMWAGKWEYGVVHAHLETRYGISWALRIKAEDGALVDFDYRYIDTVEPRNSLVRLVK